MPIFILISKASVNPLSMYLVAADVNPLTLGVRFLVRKGVFYPSKLSLKKARVKLEKEMNNHYKIEQIL
jgi:hypothetical protein